MIKRVLLTIFILFMSVCSGFTVSNREAGVSDTTSFEIQAVIQGKPVDSGNVDDDPVPYNQLIIRDLYTGDQNLVTGSEVNIGRGDRLFGEDYVDLFVVEYTSNNLAPVNIGIEIDPFTYEYKDERGQAQALVIPMSLKRQAGLKFSSSYVADLLTKRGAELVKPSVVSIPLGTLDYDPGEKNETVQKYKPDTMVIIGGLSHVKINDEIVDLDSEYATKEIESEGVKQIVEDSLNFEYEIYKPVNSSWVYKRDEESYLDWGIKYRYYNFRWEYSYESVLGPSNGTSDNYIDNGKGYVTNYVTYSLMLDEPPESGEYRMNVTVTLNAEA